MVTITEVLQFVNLIIGAWLLLWSIDWMKANHGSELYAAPIMIFALHLIVFYVSVELDLFFWGNIIDHTAWSSGLRLHGLITLALTAWSMRQMRARGIIL